MKANWPALVLCCLLPALPTWGQGANVYLAQADAGAHDGSNCANAHVYSWFNSAGNWGTGGTQIGPGTTVHICGGTYSIAYNTNFLTARGSGTSLAPVTILLDAGAVIESPAFPASGGIVLSGVSNIVINGDVTGGRQGLLQNTDEGTNLDHQGDSRAIYANGCTPGCTVENLTIAHIYDHLQDQALSSISGNGTTVTVTCAANCNVKVGNQYGIYSSTATALNSYYGGGSCTVGSPNASGYCNVAVVATASGTQFTYASTITASGTGGVVDDGVLNNTGWNAIYYGNNTSPTFTIKNVLAHDVSWAFTGWASNVTIENSEVYNADHGIAFGTNANTSGVSIHDNHFHDFANWDSASNQSHHDYIHLWDHSAGTAITGTQIYRNLFDGDFGNTTTAPIYLEESLQSTQIFNNICHLSSEGTGYNARLCFHAEGETIGGSGLQIYNNYIEVDGTPQNGGGGINARGISNVTVLNNVLIGGQYLISIGPSSSIATSCNGLTQCVDYNFYEDMNADYGNTGQFGFNGTNYTTLSAWQTSCSCDAHSNIATKTSMLYSSTTYKPLLGSWGIGSGVNLTGLGIGPLESDYGLLPRPPAGNWDVGAYQFGAVPPFVPIMRPLNLILSVH